MLNLKERFARGLFVSGTIHGDYRSTKVELFAAVISAENESPINSAGSR
jgi:hypothetical protein